MALTQKILADGQLPSSTGDLYLCPGNTDAKVTSIRLVNTDTSARTMNIFVLKSGGTARRVIPKDLSLAAGYSGVDDSPFTLNAGDKIRGDASVASKVDYVISGMEKT